MLIFIVRRVRWTAAQCQWWAKTTARLNCFQFGGQRWDGFDFQMIMIKVHKNQFPKKASIARRKKIAEENAGKEHVHCHYPKKPSRWAKKAKGPLKILCLPISMAFALNNLKMRLFRSVAAPEEDRHREENLSLKRGPRHRCFLASAPCAFIILRNTCMMIWPQKAFLYHFQKVEKREGATAFSDI